MRTSSVKYCTYNSCIDVEQEDVRDQVTMCKWHVYWPLKCFHPTGVLELRLDNLLHIEDLDLPIVKYAFIKFPRVRVDERASFKNVNMPLVETLLIDFDKRLPSFANVTLSDGLTLALRNIDTPESNRVPTSLIPQAEPYVDMGLQSILPRCVCLKLVGVPTAILYGHGCRLTLLESLSCVFSLKEDNCVGQQRQPIFAPQLSSIAFRVLAPGVVIPPLISRKRRNATLSISILAHDVNLKYFVSKTVFPPKAVYIHRLPSLSFERPNSFPFRVAEQWDKILSHAHLIQLMGFEMPFLFGEEGAFPARSNVSDTQFRFHPVMHENVEENGHLEVFPPPWGNDGCLRMNFFPIWKTPSTLKRSGTLSILTPDGNLDLHLTPVFERYLINECPVRMMPIVRQRGFDYKPHQEIAERSLPNKSETVIFMRLCVTNSDDGIIQGQMWLREPKKVIKSPMGSLWNRWVEVQRESTEVVRRKKGENEWISGEFVAERFTYYV